MRSGDIDVFQLDVDTNRIVTCCFYAIKPVFINGLDFVGFFNTEFVTGEVLLTEREGGNAVLQTDISLFQVAGVLTAFRRFFL